MAENLELVRQAVQTIKNEVEDGANTAARVGSAMSSILEYGKEQTDAETARAKAEEERINANTGISDYPTFSTANAYAVGDIVNYNGLLYEFTSAKAAGSWDASKVRRATIQSLFMEGNMSGTGDITPALSDSYKVGEADKSYAEGYFESVRRLDLQQKEKAFIHLESNSKDADVLRISSSDGGEFKSKSAYGFTMKYKGTGQGNKNYLQVLSDNGTANNQIMSMCFDQQGNVGIRGENNDEAALKVNGAAKVTGDTTIGGNIEIGGEAKFGGLASFAAQPVVEYGDGPTHIIALLEDIKIQDITPLLESGTEIARISTTSGNVMLYAPTSSSSGDGTSPTMETRVSSLERDVNSLTFSGVTDEDGVTLTMFKSAGGAQKYLIPSYDADTLTAYDGTTCLVNEYFVQNITDYVDEKVAANSHENKVLEFKEILTDVEVKHTSPIITSSQYTGEFVYVNNGVDKIFAYLHDGVYYNNVNVDGELPLYEYNDGGVPRQDRIFICNGMAYMWSDEEEDLRPLRTEVDEVENLTVTNNLKAKKARIEQLQAGGLIIMEDEDGNPNFLARPIISDVGSPLATLQDIEYWSDFRAVYPADEYCFIGAPDNSFYAAHAQTFRRQDLAKKDVAFLHLESNSIDSDVLRISSSDGGEFKTKSAYGFTLRYIGTGSGNKNYLQLFADNSTNANQNMSMCFDQLGNVGIRGENNNEAALKVNGNTKITGSLTVGTQNVITLIENLQKRLAALESNVSIKIDLTPDATADAYIMTSTSMQIPVKQGALISELTWEITYGADIATIDQEGNLTFTGTGDVMVKVSATAFPDIYDQMYFRYQ